MRLSSIRRKERMNDQEIINRGSDAEDFKRYLEDKPYFISVVANAKQINWLKICDLKPDEQMKFTILKSQQQAIEDLMSLIDIDIYNGQKAVERMQSEKGEKTTYVKGAVL